jgi:protocatechuate 3,4-dioxygenase beta subunit
MKHHIISKFVLSLVCALALLNASNTAAAKTHSPEGSTQASAVGCEPTPADYLGPYYKSDAPLRSSVGKGYILEGAVLSSTDCAPIANARIEFWLTNPEGSYDDDHRATMFSGDTGEYRFESNLPEAYYSRPPHIHIRISAEGFKTLVTQHYTTRGQIRGEFDIVLVPIE